MHSFKRLLLLVFTFTSSIAFCAQTEAARKGTEAIDDAIQPEFSINDKTLELSALKQKMAARNIPAVSIAFMQNHKITWTRTEGVIDFVSQREIDQNTLFKTTSISKPVFANVLLEYRQASDIRLETNDLPSIKSWQIPERKWFKSRPVNLRDLSSHPTGTTAHGFKTNAAKLGVPTVIEMLKEAGPGNADAILVDIEPSATLQDTNSNTTLAQVVLHNQSRMPLQALSRSPNLDPLSIEQSPYPQPVKQLAENAALPHLVIGSSIKGAAYPYPRQSTAGLWATPSELLKLASKVQKSYQAEGKSLIVSKTESELLTRQIESMGIEFYLEQQNGTVISLFHDGANDGFTNKVFIYAKTGDGIAIMTNSNNGSELINDLLSQVSEVYGWNKASQIEEEVAVLKSELRELVMGDDTDSEPLQSTVVIVAEGEQF